eukprot:SAG11_NODE_1318_length_5212_cov_3.462351_3_plen_183_part_00
MMSAPTLAAMRRLSLAKLAHERLAPASSWLANEEKAMSFLLLQICRILHEGEKATVQLAAEDPQELLVALGSAADEETVEELLLRGACPLGGIFSNTVGGGFSSACSPTPEAESLLQAANRSFRDYVGLLGALSRLCICAALENERVGEGSPLRFIEYHVMCRLVQRLPSPGARHLLVRFIP